MSRNVGGVNETMRRARVDESNKGRRNRIGIRVDGRVHGNAE